MKNNLKKLMPLNIQLFAENGDGGVATTNAENVVENVENAENKSQDKKEEKTYTRAELNKIISAEREKAKAEAIKSAEEKRTEAEKLAKMDAEEKHKYQLEKAEKEKNDALARLNAYELKEQATKIATEKELDISLLDIIDYSKETADSVKTKIDNIDTIFKKAVEKKLNEKLQERGPKQVSSSATNADREYLKNKYKNNPYYRG